MSYTAWSLVFGEQPNVAKWNLLGGNDAHFYDFLGSNTSWTSYTPTWTSVTVGNGSTAGAYIRIGKMIIARINLVRGSTTTFSGAVPLFTLPVTANVDVSSGVRIIGSGIFEDLSAASNICYFKLGSSTTCEPVALGAAATYANVERMTNTVPFAWATGDYIAGTIMYLGV
jgi:hypothetical protein